MAFAQINEDAIQSLLDSKDSKSTKRSIADAVKSFRFFLSSKQLPSDFKNFSKGELNTHLRIFYTSVRKQDGELLKNSLNVMKNGMAKYLKEKCDIDIKKDP